MKTPSMPVSIATACAIGLLSLGGVAAAQSTSGTAATSPATPPPATNRDARDEARGAARDVDLAVKVVDRMKTRADLETLLRQAKGVFVVPKFGRAALGVGGQGGVGLLMLNHNGTWSNPAFYNFGGVSAGVQAGVEGGALVLVLNNDRAVNSFLRNNNWSLDANAGLTLVNWSREGQKSPGEGDITLWSDAKGLFGALSIGVTDIKYDADQTSGYYGRGVTAEEVVQADATASSPASHQTEALKRALAAAGASTSNAAAQSGTRYSRSASQESGSSAAATGSMTTGVATARSAGTYSNPK